MFEAFFHRLHLPPFTMIQNYYPKSIVYIRVHSWCLYVLWKCLSHVRLFTTPMVYTVHGILQARILEWVAVPFSRGSSHTFFGFWQIYNDVYHHYSIIQNSFSALKIFSALPLHPSLLHWSFYCLHRFAFSHHFVSCGIIQCISYWLLSLCNIH